MAVVEGGLPSAITVYVALLISVASVLLAARSAREARRQADSAENALESAGRAGQGATVIHFTSRFFDLMRDGPRFDDPAWAYQFWSLQATEYYFYDNGWIPTFMYELWMVELVATYRSSPEVLESHRAHLERFAVNYAKMVTFFAGLADIACQEFDTLRERNLAITHYVASS